MAEGELSNGSPCLRHNCVACCIETEMPLTDEDLKRLEKLGFKRADFTIEVDGETRLKNMAKQCFFLKDGRCSIYEARPEGCRIYPLVYDIDTHTSSSSTTSVPIAPSSRRRVTTRTASSALYGG